MSSPDTERLLEQPPTLVGLTSMATSSPESKNVAPYNQPIVRHSKDDALSSLAFEQLYDAAQQLDSIHDLEAQLVLLVCGRLGLRRGELTHMQADWVDWRQRRIVIPEREPCLKGRDGGMCAHCKQMAHQKTDVALEITAGALSEIHTVVDTTDASVEDYGTELRAAQKAMGVPHDELLDLTDGLYAENRIHRVLVEHYHDDHLAQSLARRWEPKTESAARQVPFSFSPRTEMALQRYFLEEDFSE